MSELIVNLASIFNNANIIYELCKKNNISVCGVVKGCNALPPILEIFNSTNIQCVGSSRLGHLKALSKLSNNKPVWMLRTPPPSLCDDLVEFSDVCLVSELDSLIALNYAATRRHIRYKVILMLEVGDLREGWWPAENLYSLVPQIKNLTSLEIFGTGMNVSCYGSVKPSPQNIQELIDITNILSELLGYKLQIISGGNTTSLSLLNSSTMPLDVNNLRIGEAILLGRDLFDLWGTPVRGILTDTFLYRAEIIELRTKPSYPWGELFLNAFAEKPVYHDIGLRKRAILYGGKADFWDPNLLIPIDSGISIVGASSDHLIVDVEDYNGSLKVGDYIDFHMLYGAMLGLTNSKDIQISYIK
jgi:predicted amino acid racemase